MRRPSPEALFRSLTLGERIGLVASWDANVLAPHFDSDAADAAVATWQAELPVGSDLWRAKCESLGCPQELVWRALGLTHGVLDHGLLDESLSWQAYVLPSASGGDDDVGADSDRCFRGLTRPFVEEAVRGLQEQIRTIEARSDRQLVRQDPFLGSFTNHLDLSLHRLLERTAVLELNVARLSGRLGGRDSHERFRDYLALLREDRYITGFWEEYPVLLRMLGELCSNSRAAVMRLMSDLATDYASITEQFFGGNPPGEVVDIHLGLGDSHCGGRTVTSLVFGSGEQIVYKPRALDIDIHFNEFVQWLNDKGQTPKLRTPRTCSRQDHGWVEYVEPCECSGADEVDRFFERQGAYLAALHALGATDLHRENVIASGEHPVIADLETLFHPVLGTLEDLESPNLQTFVSATRASVLSTGLLPARFGAAPTVDLSGLRGRSGQLTPYRVLQWRDPGSDTWRYARDQAKLPVSHHAAQLDGQSVSVDGHIGHLLSGFERCYRLIAGHRAELSGVDGLFARFRNDRIRVVLRSTQTYGVLLQESCHPDVLRDSLARDRLFDRLWFPVERNPHLAPIIDAEQRDLWNNDVPVFTSTPGSRDLLTSSGQRFADYLSESSLQTTTARLARFSEDDLIRQTWLIHAALEIESARDRPEQGSDALGARPAAATCRPGALGFDQSPLHQALEIGRLLERTALQNEGACTWLTLGRIDSDNWKIEPCGLDLYGGIPGIALFLAYLGYVSGEERYTRLAEAAIAAIVREMESVSPTGLGLFTGGGGVVYALTHVGVLWQDQVLLGLAGQYADLLGELVDVDEDLDVVDGAAGCILSLLPLYRMTRSSHILDLMHRCGMYLAAKALPQEQGLGWRIRLEPDNALGGMAHGAAGIAWSLLALWGESGIDTLKATAVQALTYERSLFSEKHGNWRDLRESRIDPRHGHRSKFMASWCHGAPGIGMARIGVYRTLPSTEVLQDIERALTATIQHGFGGNHCLCHGDLGNLELLLLARDRVPGMSRLDTEIARLGRRIAEGLGRGVACGIPLPVQIPGLMLGLAGVGMTLLRLVDSARVPSVLLAEGPHPSPDVKHRPTSQAEPCTRRSC